ncbi:N-acetylneuraminate synthase family protein [Marivirga atlantica]|uniref:N-acetylneuraminate synthase family protein n=1 Tax=Marivirga atlantica TaxID=1548457 RepID=A0A937DGX1_9BACT|nr:N-acetylneuraminate synthase family protein [Marivirga atlantica]MBL0765243.1 N-acetylneuraminate synthase family protein [Marivirga atlantica]
MKYSEFLKTTSPYNYAIEKPFMIAEAGVNHEGDMELAKRLIHEAQEAGADAIKFQTYKADTIASKDSPSYWDLNQESTTSQHALFQKYDKFWKSEYEKLKEECDKHGIEFMSTPFDTSSATFLNDLMSVFKISSSDITNKPFVEFMARFNKPIILSTGASELYEIQEAVGWIKPYDVDVTLLHCVLNYPTPDDQANLGMISGLKHHFPDLLIGYSDHTLPKEMDTLISATLLGAKVIEKHFTHDKSLPGNDHYHAMNKEDLKHFYGKLENQLTLLGDNEVRRLPSEKLAVENARRSLVATQTIKKGDIVTVKHLTWKRPAHGISPKFIDQIIGKEALQDIQEDQVLKWNYFKFD